jgi:hypothetical protein
VGNGRCSAATSIGVRATLRSGTGSRPTPTIARAVPVLHPAADFRIDFTRAAAVLRLDPIRRAAVFRLEPIRAMVAAELSRAGD